jgi:hypothetical protein
MCHAAEQFDEYPSCRDAWMRGPDLDVSVAGRHRLLPGIDNPRKSS